MGSDQARLVAFLATLPNGSPSHDTFGRVFSRVNPAQLETGFIRWVQVLAAGATTSGGVVANDGNTVRAARDHGGSALHIVSAWASRSRLVLGQEAVDQKSNENDSGAPQTA